MVKPRSLRRVFQEQTKFLYNQEKPKAWQCSIVRAMAPSGTSFRIEAPDFDESVHLISVQDLGRHKHVKIYGDQVPLFADGTVEYEGQALALLVAPDHETLLARQRELVVQYGNAEEMEDESDVPGIRVRFDDQGDMRPMSRIVELGSPDLAFAAANKIVETSFFSDKYFKVHYEPRGAIAEWKTDTLHIQCSTSWPHLVRRAVSESTGLAQKHIVVTSLPSAFLPDRFIIDSTMLSCYAGMAALTSGKQVQLFLSSIEDVRFGTRQAPVQSRIKTSHSEGGRLLALDAELEVDIGAFPIGTEETLQCCLLGLSSSYRCPHQRIEVRLSASAQAPMFLPSAFGLGIAQQFMEQHVASVCEELEIDDLSWRIQNLVSKGDQTPYGINTEHTGFAHQALQELNKRADFQRTFAAYQLLRRTRVKATQEQKEKERDLVLPPSLASGIGMSMGFQSNGLLTSFELDNKPRITLNLNVDGHLEVSAPMLSSNVALRDVWVSCIEDLLGIEERNISFVRFATDKVDDSGPARYSRIVSLYSPLIAAACKSMAAKREKEKTPIEVRQLMSNPRRLKWDETAFNGSPYIGRSWAAASVELYVDPVQLEPVVRKVWMIVNAGAILHKERAEASVLQGIMDSLAWLGTARGPSTSQGSSTQILRGPESNAKKPAIHIEFLNQDRNEKPEQMLSHAGGVGELATTLIPAAYMNALAQALGKAMPSVPANGEEIFAELMRPFVRESPSVEELETAKS